MVVLIMHYLLAGNEPVALSVMGHPRCPDVNEKDGSGNIVAIHFNSQKQIKIEHLCHFLILVH